MSACAASFAADSVPLMFSCCGANLLVCSVNDDRGDRFRWIEDRASTRSVPTNAASVVVRRALPWARVRTPLQGSGSRGAWSARRLKPRLINNCRPTPTTALPITAAFTPHNMVPPGWDHGTRSGGIGSRAKVIVLQYAIWGILVGCVRSRLCLEGSPRSLLGREGSGPVGIGVPTGPLNHSRS